MMEVCESGARQRNMIYVSSDENKILSRLFKLKRPNGFYYDKKNRGKCVGYHWILDSIVIKKLVKRFRKMALVG